MGGIENRNGKYSYNMNMKFVTAIFLCIGVFGISVCSQDIIPRPFFDEKKSSENIADGEEMSFAYIENKILINQFFKGEVADKIIEENLAGKILGFSGENFHAEVREALIVWIGKNPNEAAKIYFNIRGHKAKFKPVKIKYIENSWTIKPSFLKLIKDLSASAADFSLTDEGLSRAGNRLFEGLLFNPEYADLNFPSFSPQEENEQAFDFADFKLNCALLAKESANLAAKIAIIKKTINQNNLEKYNAGVINDLYFKAFNVYKDFIVRASSLKGRKRIMAKESAALEKERYYLRKNLTVLGLFIEGAKINLARKRFMDAYPDITFLIKDGIVAEEKILKIAGEIEKSSMSLKNLSEKAGKAYVFGERYILKNNFYAWLIEFKSRADNIKFSCAYDFFMFKYLKFLNPASNYVRLRHQLKTDCAKLEKQLFTIKSGGEDELFSSIFKDKNGDDVFATGAVKRISEGFKRLAEFSAVNKKIQRVFWDMFFNPFKIDWDKNGKMNITVNYIGVNSL